MLDKSFGNNNLWITDFWHSLLLHLIAHRLVLINELNQRSF